MPSPWRTMSSLGTVYQEQGKDTNTEVLLRDARTSCRRLRAGDPQSLSVIETLAVVHFRKGNHKAAALLLEGLDSQTSATVSYRTDILSLISSLGVMYLRQGKFSEAELLLRKSLDGYRRIVDQSIRTRCIP
jgi:hypothetical protein